MTTRRSRTAMLRRFSVIVVRQPARARIVTVVLLQLHLLVLLLLLVLLKLTLWGRSTSVLLIRSDRGYSDATLGSSSVY